MFVGDSAVYANCVKKGSNLLYLSRVPEKINLARSLLHRDNIIWNELKDGYKIYTELVSYRDVEQRCALIFSQHAYDKEIETLNNNISNVKELTLLLKHLKHISMAALKQIKKLLKLIKN